jgi:hypothetical protein
MGKDLIKILGVCLLTFGTSAAVPIWGQSFYNAYQANNQSISVQERESYSSKAKSMGLIAYGSAAAAAAGFALSYGRGNAESNED